jgi:LPXTG-site transpeptidase (sortase) family protein
VGVRARKVFLALYTDLWYNISIENDFDELISLNAGGNSAQPDGDAGLGKDMPDAKAKKAIKDKARQEKDALKVAKSGGKKGKRKEKRGFFGVLLAIISDVLFTAAFIVALYLIWQLWFTGITANQAQQVEIERVQWDVPDDPMKAAVKLEGEPFCPDEPSQEKAMIGRVYIPQFDKDYTHTMLQGTNKVRVLDTFGFGHYFGTAMPGCVGNFSSAAHRDGYGEPLGKVEVLNPGDAIVMRTKEYWYVYKVISHEIVMPDNGNVIAPVPNHPEQKPTERLLTFTTCHPRWSLERRYIVHAKFDYWARVKSGVPQEMLDVGTRIRS